MSAGNAPRDAAVGPERDASSVAGTVDVAIFGGRGAGIMAAYSLDRSARSNGMRCVGFLNDYEPPGSLIGRHRVLGPFAHWRNLPQATRFIATLHNPKESVRRAGIVRGLGISRERWASVVDPRALVDDDTACGAGTYVAAHTRVQSGTTLGDHVTLRGGSQVSHDCLIGDFAFLGTNAVLCGYVTVGEGSYIAPGALVQDRLTIGRYSVLGLGAVVVEDVTDGTIVAGNPARVIGSVAGFEPN
jgi:sugar O-acyltransferase (sialic acid O-acetyltransferase NeuD family)